MAKTVLVTGASAGIGRATAIYLAQNGYNVYGAARRTEKIASHPNRLSFDEYRIGKYL